MAEGEDAVVERIASLMERAAGRAPVGEVWIGDDAAVVAAPSGRLVLATDAAVGGVHADLELVGVDDLGWKALTSTLSDIAAMGATPSHALVSFALPPGTDVQLLAAGVAEASSRWGCPVVGGDVSASDQLVVVACVAGVLEGPLPPVLRAGASAGDALVVTGPLGGSAAGLRLLRAGEGTAAAPSDVSRALVAAHRRPQCRLLEGVVARAAGATAMMDVSDGLGIDLHRLARASGVGIALDVVPVAPGATDEEALGGGEDFELIVATPEPDRLASAFAERGLRPPIVVGRCTSDERQRTWAAAPLGRAGFEHRVG